MLKVKQTEKHNFSIEFDTEFERLSSRQKLDLLTDALIDLNKKWDDVNENY